MRPLSRRDGIWIEIPELDLADDVTYVLEAFAESILQADSETTDTGIASDLLANNDVIALSDRVNASDVVAGELTAPLLTDTLNVSEVLAVPLFLTGSTDTVAASDTLGYNEAAVTEDTVSLTETLAGLLAQVGALADTVTARDADAALFSGVTSDTVIASETLTSLDLPADVVDTLTARDSLVGVLAASWATVDTSVATDGLTGEWLTTQTDTVVASEGLASALTTAWQDTLRATETLGGVLAVTDALSDRAVASDVLSYGYLGLTADTATATDNVAGTLAVYSPILADTVAATDLLAGPVAVYAEVLTDTATATDGLSGGVVLVGVLADTVLAGDTLADEAYSLVVVTNAETGAVSTYTMTPAVAGLAEYRGTLYLAGSDGLYAMDATADADGEVVWTLRTGFSNLGSDLLKRVRDVNIQGRTDGGLTVQAMTDRYGQKQEHHYLLPALTRAAYRDGVVKIGQGLQSVYWALGIQGKGPAEVDQLRVAVEPLSRRR